MFAEFNTPNVPTTIISDDTLTLESFRSIIDNIPQGTTRTYFVYAATSEVIGLPKKTFFVIACYGGSNTKILLAYPVATDSTPNYKMVKTSGAWRDWTSI